VVARGPKAEVIRTGVLIVAIRDIVATLLDGFELALVSLHVAYVVGARISVCVSGELAGAVCSATILDCKMRALVRVEVAIIVGTWVVVIATRVGLAAELRIGRVIAHVVDTLVKGEGVAVSALGVGEAARRVLVRHQVIDAG